MTSSLHIMAVSIDIAAASDVIASSCAGYSAVAASYCMVASRPIAWRPPEAEPTTGHCQFEPSYVVNSLARRTNNPR